ncbi:hypothetical protein ACA910_021670 [Epithemia clementina (nom. ined.)]
MTEAENQAKQLDSVTDRVEEQEVDLDKAQEAMTSLSTPSGGKQAEAGGESQQVVSKEDVQIICDELEVTSEVASNALRQVLARRGETKEGESLVAAALRKLITS